MLIYFIIYILICLIGLKFFKSDFNKDYLSKEQTNAIKGIFVLLVFFSHFSTYIPNIGMDAIFVKIVRLFGQLMVTLFIFYSGYGVLESIKKKGTNYINNMPKNRILKVLLNFWVAIILFIIVDLILGNPYSIKDYLLAFTSWTSIGNSNWFIFCIIYCYIITYISYKLFKTNTKSIISIIFLCLVYIYVLHIFKDNYWYNTIICYPLGLLYSLYKNKINRLLFNNKAYVISFIATLIAFIITYKFNKNCIIFQMNVVSFTLLVVLTTMKFKFNNKFINYCGANIFGIYILQRIPMMLFKGMNPYIYIILCFITLMIMIIPFNIVINKLNSLIKKS